MSTRLYWDREARLIRAYDPAELTPQQRGNLVLLQGIIDSEYSRGYRRGVSVGYAAATADGRTKRGLDGKLILDKTLYDPVK